MFSRFRGVASVLPGLETSGQGADTPDPPFRNNSAARALDASLGQLQYKITSRSGGIAGDIFPNSSNGR